MSLEDTLARIDVAIGSCAQCGGPRGDSPSDDFCSQDCQEEWWRARSTPDGAYYRDSFNAALDELHPDYTMEDDDYRAWPAELLSTTSRCGGCGRYVVLIITWRDEKPQWVFIDDVYEDVAGRVLLSIKRHPRECG